MDPLPVTGSSLPADLPVHRRGFRYADLTIGVASPEPSHLAWLEEFLAPAFESTAPDESGRWVVLDTDATRHSAMLARGPSPASPPVACFVLDGRTVRHPEWSGSGPGERILFDTVYETFYRIERPSGHVRILAPPRPIPPRATLMRVVRELAMATSLARGRLVIHGAAFAAGRRGVVLAGPKLAGKTSLLLHALQAAGTAFISNDRVVVRRDRGRLTLRGMPTIVNIRRGTLAAFPAVAARVRARGFHHTRTLAESDRRAGGEPALSVDGAASLTTAQLCEATQAAPFREAHAWRLVFPRVTDSIAGLRLERLDAGTAARRLRAAWFAVRSPGEVSEAFSSPDGGAGMDEAALDRRAAELTSEVPCYDAQLGVGAYGGPGAADEFLAQLAAPPPLAARPRP